MDVSLKLTLHNSIYSLVFTFDAPLNDIDFTLSRIDSLIYIYIS